jgi:hypothetical protein
VIWNVFDSETTLEELREHLPPPAEGETWIENAVQERLGVISFGDTPPELARLRDLIGKEPEIFEEFDVLE